MNWDEVTNADIKSDCLLGWFKNHDDDSQFGVFFGMLTAVKAADMPVVTLDGCRYEEHYGRRWKHFRPASRDEVSARCFY